MSMRAVLEGDAEIDHDFDQIIGHCLGCRACEPVCPGLVPYGRLLEGARAEIATQLPRPHRRLLSQLVGQVVRHPILLKTGTTGLRMVQQRWTRRSRLTDHRRTKRPVGRFLSGLRRLQPTQTRRGTTSTPAGEIRGTVGVLAGCVLDSWFGEVHDATVELLRASGFQVIFPASQTCCGALAAHQGVTSSAQRMAEENIAAFASTDFVVANAAGCSAHLKNYAHWGGGSGEKLAAKTKDICELVAELISQGVLPWFDQHKGRVAVQEPCHLLHAQRLGGISAEIVSAAGYEPVQVDPAGLCCGAAGVYSLLQPEFSRQLGENKAQEVRAAGSTLVVSANPGCEMQLRTHLSEEYLIRHPVELYWQSWSENRD